MTHSKNLKKHSGWRMESMWLRIMLEGGPATQALLGKLDSTLTAVGNHYTVSVRERWHGLIHSFKKLSEDKGVQK